MIEQTDLAITLLNGRQFEVGQCIVLPLRHAPTLLDLNDAEDAAVMASAKHITEVMVKAFAPPHIARLEGEIRPAHADHVAVTDEKIQTVKDICQHL